MERGGLVMLPSCYFVEILLSQDGMMRISKESRARLRLKFTQSLRRIIWTSMAKVSMGQIADSGRLLTISLGC
ncbi:hypothetical protein I7I48_07916 [Histoplasma ohiense]|nr:hypothetical protein I7I48_07916 [Histoplasma ohiense (nom. inval.)]